MNKSFLLFRIDAVIIRIIIVIMKNIACQRFAYIHLGFSYNSSLLLFNENSNIIQWSQCQFNKLKIHIAKLFDKIKRIQLNSVKKRNKSIK